MRAGNEAGGSGWVRWTLSSQRAVQATVPGGQGKWDRVWGRCRKRGGGKNSFASIAVLPRAMADARLASKNHLLCFLQSTADAWIYIWGLLEVLKASGSASSVCRRWASQLQLLQFSQVSPHLHPPHPTPAPPRRLTEAQEWKEEAREELNAFGYPPLSLFPLVHSLPVNRSLRNLFPRKLKGLKTPREAGIFQNFLVTTKSPTVRVYLTGSQPGAILPHLLPPGNIWHCLEEFLVVTTWRMPLAAVVEAMLLRILWCTRQPPDKELSNPKGQ